MAERRMFAKSVITSDKFMGMPLSSQALYIHLNMNADDDGFVGNPKMIVRMTGASEDDFKLLIFKKFVIPFKSEIIAITHWKTNNFIRKDRYKETVYISEKRQLEQLMLNSDNLLPIKDKSL